MVIPLLVLSCGCVAAHCKNVGSGTTEQPQLLWNGSSCSTRPAHTWMPRAHPQDDPAAGRVNVDSLGVSIVRSTRLYFVDVPQAHFHENPKIRFNTSNGTEIIAVSILFRRLKNTVCVASRDWQYSSFLKLEADSKSQYSVHTRGLRGMANAQRFFY